MKRGFLSSRRFGLLLALVLWTQPSSAADTEKKDIPVLETGMVESTEVVLMLLDVEATDAEGRPMRGLTLRDFAVQVGGRAQPLYSVDDLCPCGRTTEKTVGPPFDPNRDLAGKENAAAAAPAQPEPVQFVLYLDFSQLGQDGRYRAVEAAKRWISETMGPQDRAMVVAYAEGAGLRTLSSLTDDKAELSAAAQEAYDAADLVDPFPITRSSRRAFCQRVCSPSGPSTDCACWLTLAREEYLHGRRSFESMKWLLARLGDTPGRKSLVFFSQDATMFPARYYPVDESRIGDHIGLVDQIGAEAILSRTSIYTAFSGAADNPLATSLGASLADFTGGGYNRGPAGLARFVRGVGRGCECIYRIGLVPPEGGDAGVHKVTVEARGRRLPNSYRVQFLSPADRWMRSARAVLAAPDSARDIPLSAAIVPVASRAGGWDARVQVALDPSSMALVPPGPGSKETKGSWEVGALLSDEGARRSWEMIGVSELHGAQETERALPAVVHERVIEGIRPGAYELRAFVRETWTNLYGGARVRIDLPRANGATMTGPQVLRADRSLVRTTLPLRGENSEAGPSASRVAEKGSLPLSDRPAPLGEHLEFLTWICPGKPEDHTLDEAIRFLTHEDQTLLHFDAPAIVQAGDCARLGDTLDTTAMTPGRYAYHVRWTPDPHGEPREAEAFFEIASPPEPTPPKKVTADVKSR